MVVYVILGAAAVGLGWLIGFAFGSWSLLAVELIAAVVATALSSDAQTGVWVVALLVVPTSAAGILARRSLAPRTPPPAP